MTSDRLPFVDEHVLRVDASPESTWQALVAWTERHLLRPAPQGFALLWKLEPASGFGVAERVEGKRLVLGGRHRFARYQLVFELDEPAMLRARTFAMFPGIAGRLYRAAVIGSGGHALVVRDMLRRIARRANRGAPPR